MCGPRGGRSRRRNGPMPDEANDFDFTQLPNWEDLIRRGSNEMTE